MNNLKYDNYEQSLEKNAIKLSVYNYADDFIAGINDNATWYVYINEYTIGNGLTGDYYYECTKKTWNLLMSNQVYTWIFCTINIFDEKIFKYKLIP